MLVTPNGTCWLALFLLLGAIESIANNRCFLHLQEDTFGHLPHKVESPMSVERQLVTANSGLCDQRQNPAGTQAPESASE